MESWGYPSEGKGHFFPEEIDFPIDVLLRSTKALFEWGHTDTSNSVRDGVLSPGEAVENFDFFPIGSPDYIHSSIQNNQCLEASSCERDCDFNKLMDTAGDNISCNSSAVQEESPIKHSISFMNSESPASALIDLKFGVLDDFTDVQYIKLAQEGLNVSLGCQTTLGKKDRTEMGCHQASICQVYGCNIELSSLKDYHKRHRVCDVHSKAAKVVVNGFEQRFCQQCSRFHRLDEFDDTKRSCRRRLAGHNERRRKSEFDNLSGRPRKLIPLYHGSKSPGISLLRKSQGAFGNIFQGGFFYPGKQEQLNQSEGYKKLVKESMYRPEKFDLLSRSFLSGNGKRFSSKIDSSGTENRNPGKSSSALSFLSLQSQALLNHAGGDSMASTLTFQGISAYLNDSRNSHTPFRDSLNEGYPITDSYFHGLNSTKVDQIGTMMLSDVGHAVDLEVCRNDFHQSNSSNANISAVHGCTVNLLQLSTNLHRVEQQRQYILGNHGTRTFVASSAFNWTPIQ